MIIRRAETRNITFAHALPGRMAVLWRHCLQPIITTRITNFPLYFTIPYQPPLFSHIMPVRIGILSWEWASWFKLENRPNSRLRQRGRSTVAKLQSCWLLRPYCEPTGISTAAWYDIDNWLFNQSNIIPIFFKLIFSCQLFNLWKLKIVRQ